MFKRRLIFSPLPETEPLQAHNRGPPAGDEAPVIPLLHPEAPVIPRPPVITMAPVMNKPLFCIIGPFIRGQKLGFFKIVN